jgi:hypothetical protein
MNVEIGTVAAQFPEKEYLFRIWHWFFAVRSKTYFAFSFLQGQKRTSVDVRESRLQWPLKGLTGALG